MIAYVVFILFNNLRKIDKFKAVSSILSLFDCVKRIH